MERTWICFECESNDAQPLCVNPDATFNATLLATRYLSSGSVRNLPAAQRDFFQVRSCVEEMIEAAPAAVLTLLFAALEQCRSVGQVSALAAGPLEELLQRNGAAVIGALQEAAASSATVRYSISGTWARDRIAPEVWARLVTAVAQGPVMDADSRTPGAGLHSRVLDAADIAVLLAT
jgi:hypothetical protein